MQAGAGIDRGRPAESHRRIQNKGSIPEGNMSAAASAPNASIWQPASAGGARQLTPNTRNRTRSPSQTETRSGALFY